MSVRKGCLTAAGRFIRKWLDDNDKDQQWLLDELNRRRDGHGVIDRVTRTNLWRWMTGKNQINIDDAALIAEITGLPMRLWSRYASDKDNRAA
jgi:hypothetical protein